MRLSTTLDTSPPDFLRARKGPEPVSSPALSSRQPSIAAPSATSLLRRLSEVDGSNIRSTAKHCGLEIVGWLSIIIEYCLVCDEEYEVRRGSLTGNQEWLCARKAIHTI